MDFPQQMDLQLQIGLSPANYTLVGIPPCRDGGCAPTNRTLPLGFAGLWGLEGLLLTDGINEAGLAGAMLWNDVSPASDNYT